VLRAVLGALRGRASLRKPTHPEAIAFVNLTGFTRLTEQRGDEAEEEELAQVLASLVQRAARSHGGRMVKLLGDGAMLYFADPRDAVLCGLDVVERVADLGLPPAHIGLHAGRVIHQDGDYYGRTVNVAARVADRAGPGEVLVTTDVVLALGDGASFAEVGPVMLKGLDEPIILYRAELVSSPRSGAARPEPPRSIDPRGLSRAHGLNGGHRRRSRG
jgi:class 3 adenylate cyclase